MGREFADCSAPFSGVRRENLGPKLASDDGSRLGMLAAPPESVKLLKRARA